jgi:hypothetical protein
MTIPFGINALQRHCRILVMDSDIQIDNSGHNMTQIASGPNTQHAGMPPTSRRGALQLESAATKMLPCCNATYPAIRYGALQQGRIPDGEPGGRRPIADPGSRGWGEISPS